MFNSYAANSSVSFSTLPETNGKELEFDFSPKRMPSLMGWSWEELKLFGTEVCACSGQRQESSVLWWELLCIAGAWHLPSLKQVSKKSCPARSRLNDAWCLSSLLAADCWAASFLSLGWQWMGETAFKLFNNSDGNLWPCWIAALLTFHLLNNATTYFPILISI